MDPGTEWDAELIVEFPVRPGDGSDGYRPQTIQLRAVPSQGAYGAWSA